jgi:hypothetical protein
MNLLEDTLEGLVFVEAVPGDKAAANIGVICY